MTRILLSLEYDGTGYAGWQQQQNGLAVQQVVEETLARACGHPVTVTGSSRTDAGVHALAQQAHFDTSCAIPPEKYPFVLNTMLPPDIRAKTGRQVPEEFHARFLSCGKTYTYRFFNHRQGTALFRNLCWHIPVPLDLPAMKAALSFLPGTHDFAAFQAAGGTAKTTLRTLERAELKEEDPFLILTVSGNAFLYNMVRIIAGTLAEIGLHRLPVNSFETALKTGNRLSLGMTAPPQGLTLAEVRYPDQAFTDPASLRWHQP